MLKFDGLLLYQCVSGSHLYNLNAPDSDIDYDAVYMPPISRLCGLDSTQKIHFYRAHAVMPDRASQRRSSEPEEIEFTVYPLHKFALFLTKGNFRVFESLFASDENVTEVNDYFKPFREQRKEFLGYHIVKPGANFAKHNFNHLTKRPNGLRRQAIFDKYGFDTKYAMHGIRILDSLNYFLCDGEFRVEIPAGDVKDFYMDIRAGKYSLKECEQAYAVRLEQLECMMNNLDLRLDGDTKHQKEQLQDIRSKVDNLLIQQTGKYIYLWQTAIIGYAGTPI